MWGGAKGLEERIINDGIKDTFCKNNNISLIRIKQSEISNIENILKEKLGVQNEIFRN
jgi:hypothetical protein